MAKKTYSTTFDFEEIEIDGKPYVLREPSGDAATKWRNTTTSGARLADGKVVGLSGIADADPLLVSLCLFECYENRGQTMERPVTLLQVRSWPDRIQKELAEAAKRLGNLVEKTPSEGEQSADPIAPPPAISTNGLPSPEPSDVTRGG